MSGLWSAVLAKWPLVLKSHLHSVENELVFNRHLLDEVSEILDQPFTETNKHLPAWAQIIQDSRDYQFEELKHARASVKAEQAIVKSRDLTILERDTEIVELTGKLETVEARYKAALDALEAAIHVPAPETVPFCVDCHQGIKRGMPFHILTIRHGDCRFVGEPSSTPSEREDSQAGCVEPDSAKIGESGAFRDVSDFIKANSESAEISDHLASGSKSLVVGEGKEKP